jgi:hypothetical protein
MCGFFWPFDGGCDTWREGETLLTGGLLRWARRTEIAWMSKSVETTAFPFFIATTALFALGLWAHYHCPTATRVSEVWDCLR